jgi:aminoglycoside/choline kinase family phosphotransferase
VDPREADASALRNFLRRTGEPALGTWTAGETRLTVEPLAGDGSSRRIYRLVLPGRSVVSVVNPLQPNRLHPDENEGFVAVRAFMADRGVHVPEILATDLDAGILLLEDLGETRLFDLVDARRDAGERFDSAIRAYYLQAIEGLARLQAPSGVPFDAGATSNPAYTAEFVFAQESRYFHEEVVRGRFGREIPFATIASDCSQLAEEAVADLDSRVFLHRDYQSRNLMLQGERLVVIDFQGARGGPPEYDLAALLYDPYVRMPEVLREEMIRSYRGLSPWNNPPAWRRRFLANGANRLMQALGAFAKLGGRLGKPGFLEHIPHGLAQLETVLIERDDCPALLDLVRDLRREGTERPVS